MPRHDELPSAFGLGAFGYYLDFALAPVAAMALIVIAARGGLAWTSIAPLLVLGFVLWGLAEYLIHRFAFHDFPVLRRMHDVHHRLPKEYIGVASWGVFLGAAIAFGAFAVVLGISGASAATAGLLLGYLFYIVIHDRFHHGDRSRFGTYVKYMERFHAGHHRGGEWNFGVSSPVFDLVFGTYRSPR